MYGILISSSTNIWKSTVIHISNWHPLLDFQICSTVDHWTQINTFWVHFSIVKLCIGFYTYFENKLIEFCSKLCWGMVLYHLQKLCFVINYADYGLRTRINVNIIDIITFTKRVVPPIIEKSHGNCMRSSAIHWSHIGYKFVFWLLKLYFTTDNLTFLHLNFSVEKAGLVENTSIYFLISKIYFKYMLIRRC